MLRTFTLMSTLFACQPHGHIGEPAHPADTDAGDRLPSPAPIELSVEGLAAGHRALFSAGGLIAGERAHLLIGTEIGEGPCLPVIGSQCLDLVAPFMKIGEGIANAEGIARVIVEVPSSVDDGRTGNFQAWVRRGDDGEGSVASLPSEAVTAPPELPGIAGHWTDDWGIAHHVQRRTWIMQSLGSSYSFEDQFHLVISLPLVGGGSLIAQNDEDNLYAPGAWSRFDYTHTEEGGVFYCQQAFAAANYDEAVNTPAADLSDPLSGGCGVPPYTFSFTHLDSVEMPIAGSYMDEWGALHDLTEEAWTMTYAFSSGFSSTSQFSVTDWEGDDLMGSVIAQNAEDAPYDAGRWSRFDYAIHGGELYYCQTRFNAGSEAEAADSPPADPTSPDEGGCGEPPYDFTWTLLTGL